MADESSGEQLLASYFEATPEEKARVALAPFLTNDVEKWKEFAHLIRRAAIGLYQAGEISAIRALRAVRSSSVGCAPLTRKDLLALTALHLLTHPPQASKKKVRHPLLLRRAAARLLHLHRQARPSEPFAPTEHNRWTTPILEGAIAWLRALDFCDDVTPRVLYRWYRKAEKDGVLNEPDSLAPDL